MKQTSTRAGRIVKTISGYEAFVPAKLPPVPAIQIDSEMLQLLSSADNRLGRLDGITQTLPNPELFVAMYVKKEALLSAQIEGTQASLADVLNDQPEKQSKDYSADGVKEVVNYVNAVYYGLNRLNDLPLSLRLIREIHGVLLQNVRGSEKSPGEFRTTQNWIGPKGCTLVTATFIPPEPAEMLIAMSDLEKYFYDDAPIPPLIKIALIHAQFETIHPFLDGNGRMGRLLITFWLCCKSMLSKPMLYLSYYFKSNRSEYYQSLMNVRFKGDWEAWIKFFLKGVVEVSDEAIESAKRIINLQQNYTEKLNALDGNSGNHIALLNALFENPIISKTDASNILSVSAVTAGTIVETFCNLGILYDLTPKKKRYKKYIFKEYFEILQRGTEL